MEEKYSEYKMKVIDDVQQTLDEMGCQPILFIGSGLSKRFFGGPNWEELLIKMAEDCPEIEKDFLYYKQSYKNLEEIGQVFADAYKEWAWGSGRESIFPPELYTADMPPNIYFKYMIGKYFDSITPKAISSITDEDLVDEISLLQEIRPHAIITTNYDRFLEVIYPEYTPIIGQKILYSNHTSIGEIFKIHGCTSKIDTIVITEGDYEEFINKKKYLSAKLLTYFIEHPLLFIGYRAGDQNIKAILSDIDEILSPNGELIPNIYFLEWKEDILSSELPPTEKIIPINTNKNIRIKSITASSFKWVFEAFAMNEALEKVNPKLLRALLARTYQLVRHDIPRKTIEVDYTTLEHAVNDENEMAKIYGITPLNDPIAVNAAYPYTLTQVGKKLGYETWHNANKLIDKVKEEKEFNIKESDNPYHIAIKTGSKLKTHKYSDATVELLTKVKDDESYEIVYTTNEENVS
ncbi:MAG: SIR2 family protein [Firmicutes bacterium]|nr:SIR2 family protein [Bacillota bacterium]